MGIWACRVKKEGLGNVAWCFRLDELNMQEPCVEWRLPFTGVWVSWLVFHTFFSLSVPLFAAAARRGENQIMQTWDEDQDEACLA